MFEQSIQLNARALAVCEKILADARLMQVDARRDDTGARIVDCGISSPGGLSAGLCLAEACMAGLAQVRLQSGADGQPTVVVHTDHPVAACMASQYAGWQIARGKFFGMGSGPMRAAAAKEELFQKIGYREETSAAVGVIETRKSPPPEVTAYIAEECGVKPDKLTLLVAPTASPAGTLQVVARSIETALHKLFELGFDLSQIVSGWGTAPLPPVAKDDIAAIGRTNDAILYGGDVTLWVRADDDALAEIGPRVPANASHDYGRPFVEIFERYDRDFYKIDPHLFSPGRLTLMNLNSGRTFRFGSIRPEILEQSFYS